VWNWVEMEDRSRALNAFSADARKYAEQAPFVSQARDNMEKKLTEILKLHGKKVTIHYTEIERIDPR
jgi:hypothetical protein